MVKLIKRWYERNYASGNFLYIKTKSPYVKGVIGKDIKLTFRQKIQIFFANGISVAFIEERIK